MATKCKPNQWVKAASILLSNRTQASPEPSDIPRNQEDLRKVAPNTKTTNTINQLKVIQFN